MAAGAVSLGERAAAAVRPGKRAAPPRRSPRRGAHPPRRSPRRSVWAWPSRSSRTWRELVSIGPTEDLAANVVEVRTRAGLRRDPAGERRDAAGERRDPAGERRFAMTSSCGVCGKAALEFVTRVAPPAQPSAPIEPELVLRLPRAARAAQPGFRRTGGLHATALFEPDGRASPQRRDTPRAA
jgi:formate dehydrogenase assembly factor FdhD